MEWAILGRGSVGKGVSRPCAAAPVRRGRRGDNGNKMVPVLGTPSIPGVTVILIRREQHCNPVSGLCWAPYKLRYLRKEAMLYIYMEEKRGMQRDSTKRLVMELVFISLTHDEFGDECKVVEDCMEVWKEAYAYVAFGLQFGPHGGVRVVKEKSG